MISAVKVLLESELLDWPTVALGFRQQWMSVEEVESFAVSLVLKDVDPPSEVVDLTSSQLSDLDIRERLDVLVEGSLGVDERVSLRRWLFASLTVLDQSSVDEDTKLVRLQELYAEFGFPEELRYVSPYNFLPLERSESVGLGGQTSSPLHWFQTTLEALRVELVGSVDERPDGLGGGA